jgi:ComF family protein
VAPGTPCGDCQRRPPPFDAAFAPLRYEYPLPQLIGAMKFRGRLAPARLLGALLAEALAGRAEPLPEVLIPVPLHPSRLRERGYNQALEIARALARHCPLPVAPRLLIRQRPTRPQSELSGRERRRNLRGAFVPLPGVRLPDHVALLDDVITTGTTLAELAKVLKGQGVRRVEAWAVARTP